MGEARKPGPPPGRRVGAGIQSDRMVVVASTRIGQRVERAQAARDGQ